MASPQWTSRWRRPSSHGRTVRFYTDSRNPIGERVIAHADGPGRVVLEREHDMLADFAGVMTGAYATNELDTLRAEWD